MLTVSNQFPGFLAFFVSVSDQLTMLYFLPLIGTKIIQIYLAEIGLNFAFSVKGTLIWKKYAIAGSGGSD